MLLAPLSGVEYRANLSVDVLLTVLIYLIAIARLELKTVVLEAVSCNKLVVDEVELTRDTPYVSSELLSLSTNVPDMSIKYVPVEANVIFPEDSLTIPSGSNDSTKSLK